MDMMSMMMNPAFNPYATEVKDQSVWMPYTFLTAHSEHTGEELLGKWNVSLELSKKMGMSPLDGFYLAEKEERGYTTLRFLEDNTDLTGAELMEKWKEGDNEERYVAIADGASVKKVRTTSDSPSRKRVTHVDDGKVCGIPKGSSYSSLVSAILGDDDPVDLTRNKDAKSKKSD